MTGLLHWLARVGVTEVTMPGAFDDDPHHYGRPMWGGDSPRWGHGSRARHGQLVTSDHMNDILRRLDALEARP